jgi:tetratricopeptide (TPR) repeat protein
MRQAGPPRRLLLGVVTLALWAALPAVAQQNPEDFIEEITDEDNAPADAPSDDEGDKPADPPPESADAPTAPADDGDAEDEAPRRGRPDDGDQEAEASPAAGDARRNGNGNGRGRDTKKTRDKDKDKEGAPGASVDAGGVPALRGYQLRELSYGGLLERWDARRAALRSRADNRVRQETLFFEGMAELGLHGVEGGVQGYDLARALAVEARQARERNERERARELLDAAIKASPDSPSVHLAAAETELKVGSLFVAVGHVIRAGQASTRSPEHLVASSARVAAAAGFVILALLALVAVLTLWKAFRFLVFDLWGALPRGAARWQVMALLAIGAVVPLIAGAGPVFTALLWITLGFVYLERREQIAVALVGGLLVIAPVVVGFGARTFSFPGSDLSDKWRALSDVAATAERERYRALPEDSLPLAAAVSLGDSAFREGRLEEAGQRWRKIVQRAGDQPWVHNNLGIIAVFEGKPELAKAAFRDAINRSNGDPLIPAFNLSLLALRNPRKHALTPDVQALIDNGGPALAKLNAITYRAGGDDVSQSRAFVWAPMPHDVMADLWATPPQAAASFEAELAKIFYLGLRPLTAMIAFGIFLLVWFVLSRLAARLLPSRGCVRCGSPASTRYDGQEVPRGTCGACYHAFDAPGAKVDAAGRVAKERQIQRYVRGRSRTAILLSLLFSGAGHFYLGAPFKALAYAATFAVALGSLGAIGLDLLPWPSPSVADVGWLMWGPPALVAVITYALSIRGASQEGV